MHDYAHNRILLSSNPILFICLACEYLTTIQNSISIFRHTCNIIVTRMQGLGQKIVENMDFETIEKIFMDQDFKNRAVLKIITEKKYAKLLTNDKINTLLDSLFMGRETFQCDGRL